jgi:proton-translocating NADH-quinone oxidoreductase chain N
MYWIRYYDDLPRTYTREVVLSKKKKAISMALMFLNDFKAVIPEMFCVTSILGLLVYGVVYSTSSSYGYPILSRNVTWLSILTLVITALLVANHSYQDAAIFQNTLIVDHFTQFVKVVVLLSAAAALLVSLDYLRLQQINSFEYGILISLATLGMILLVSSYDLISMYLAIELQSLCLYVLAALKRNSEFSTEAGLKYFILGAFSSGILLFGSSLVYGFTGMTNFEDLAKLFTASNSIESIQTAGALIGLLLIAVGLLFKVYAVPFHVWVPDVYEGSPTIVTTYFAITPSLSVLAVFLRLFLSTFYDFLDYWQQILVFCSIASMIVATFAALSQKKIKRLLAYSAIGHSGYMLIGFASGTPDGVQAILLYSVIYIMMTLGMFTFLLATRDLFKSEQIKYLSDMNVLFRTNPVLALSVALILFSLAGIPPLAGFIGKLYVFFAAIKVSMYFIVLVGVITSVIGTVYYLRLIQIMYFDKAKTLVTYQPIDKIKSIVLAVTCFFLVFFIFYPSPLMIMTHKAALYLCL